MPTFPARHPARGPSGPGPAQSIAGAFSPSHVFRAEFLGSAHGIVHNEASGDNTARPSPVAVNRGPAISMNYFAHGIRFVDRPWFLAGTALPDWLSVIDRRVRLRPKVMLQRANG